MRKTVSRKDGYSIILEKVKDDDIQCFAFKTGMHMKTEDVARHLNISKGTVSNSLRRSVKQIYKNIKKQNKILNSIEIICIMADWFNIKSHLEYKQFFKLFPDEIKGEVYEDAKETGYHH